MSPAALLEVGVRACRALLARPAWVLAASALVLPSLRFAAVVNGRARWSLGIFVGYLTGATVGHVIAWVGRRIDAHLARVTDLGGDD